MKWYNSNTSMWYCFVSDAIKLGFVSDLIADFLDHDTA